MTSFHKVGLGFGVAKWAVDFYSQPRRDPVLVVSVPHLALFQKMVQLSILELFGKLLLRATETPKMLVN